MKTKKLLQLLIVALFFSLPAMAQPQDPGGDPDGPADVPVDGGLSILLVAGVGYVAKKGYEKRKKTVSFNEQV